MKRITVFSFIVIFLFPAAFISAEGFSDMEAGIVFTGYNDVKIPSDSGTRFSLKNDIRSDPALALRLRAGYTFADRHTVYFLAAPLTVHGSGTPDRDIRFQGKLFTAGTKVESRYRFDSYRATYRYSFYKGEILMLGAGITGKIRSADIALMSDTAYAHRSNIGYVPLINFAAQYRFTRSFSFLFETDALASPYGRAEDALFALQCNPSDTASLRMGYRILEGGSDGGGKVYTFALFHYLTAGITVMF